MEPRTGYNLVRGRAVGELYEYVAHRYGLPEPETLSAVSFLRYVHRCQPFPHPFVQVVGFHDLWRVCADTGGLARMLYRLFLRRMNWMQNQNPYIYFVLPEQVTFSNAAHLALRLSSDLYADMTDVFGQLTQVSSEHYHHTFTVSQV